MPLRRRRKPCFASAYYESERFEEAAERIAGTVLAIDANYAGAHRELGKVLVSQREPGGRRRNSPPPSEQNPNDAEALYFLGGLLMQEDRRRRPSVTWSGRAN